MPGQAAWEDTFTVLLVRLFGPLGYRDAGRASKGVFPLEAPGTGLSLQAEVPEKKASAQDADRTGVPVPRIGRMLRHAGRERHPRMVPLG